MAARAFYDYPASIHTMPNEEKRKKKGRYGFIVELRYGIKIKQAYTTSPNLEGVTVWNPPKVRQSLWDLIKSGGLRAVRRMGFGIIRRGWPIISYLDAAHKRLAPMDHWHLATLAVDPEHQGKGYGSLLLKAKFKEIDEQGFPVYVETSTEENVRFYEKHGFEVLEHVTIPKTNVPNWCMLRKPQ